MVADLFKRDYRQMTEQGVKFTPEDIVRLNALAVKVKMRPDAASSVALPRLAFLPKDSVWRVPIVLREPTVAHELWIEMCERFIDTSRDKAFLFLYAFALSRHPGLLPDPSAPRKVVKAVFKFAEKRLARFTRAQLQGAVEYVLFGADWKVGERAAEKGSVRSARDSRAHVDESVLVGHEHYGTPSPILGLLDDFRMIRLPITLADAQTMTASELEEVKANALKYDGRFDIEGEKNRAFAAYVRTREEIRARSNGKNPPDEGGNEK